MYARHLISETHMKTSDAVALYAAGLSTLLALAQFLQAWRRRSRIVVDADLVYSSRGSHGTPVLIERGSDVLEETVSVRFTIRNLGGSPVQILGLLLESGGSVARARTLNTHQISPQGLPVV